MKGFRSRHARARGPGSRGTPLGRGFTSLRRIPRTPIAAAIALACQPAMAQQQLEEIIVTAQTRAEKMQYDPISIQSL